MGPIRFAYRLEAQVKRLQRYPHGSRNLDFGNFIGFRFDSRDTRIFFKNDKYFSIDSFWYPVLCDATVQNEVQLHLNFPYIGIKVKLDYY